MKQFATVILVLLVGSVCFGNGAGDAGEKPLESGVDVATVSDFDEDLKFAQVVSVKAVLDRSGSWRFEVTVRHNDEGWDHYADLWEVVDPNTSEVYGERVLAHPHDTEQPFTRSQSGVEIPVGTDTVLIRAKCNKHDFSGKAVLVNLSASEGDGFTVIR